jgi:hypothetical protein
MAIDNSNLKNWDPLSTAKEELTDEIISARTKREIRNIIKSYTGWYDSLSELMQNALDAVDTRLQEEGKDSGYVPQIWVRIDLKNNLASVTDNGVGFNQTQFKNFLKPNISFKGGQTRGVKGVGATYLAYGFNFLQFGTKTDDFYYCGTLRNGREWVEDDKGVVPRPIVQSSQPIHNIFNSIDAGSTFTLKFIGKFIHPSDLKWIRATNARQWSYVLRISTPLGGIYLGREPTKTACHLSVVDEEGKESTQDITECTYIYPHEVVSACVDLKDIQKKQQALISKGRDPSKLPANFYNLNGIYSAWDWNEIISKDGAFRLRLDDGQRQLLQEQRVRVYGFFCYSTNIWDEFNDNFLKLRKGGRILRGGLQLATNGMPQGRLLVIPLTSNIGYQQQSHMIVHFESAEPDLGRKGFQPDLQEISESISVSVVGLLKRWRKYLKKATGAPHDILEDSKLDAWVKQQEEHEKTKPLVIKNPEFFLPVKEISITSEPLNEQDVISLFNQLIAGGVIRGIKIMATSEHEKYDGIYRVWLKEPFENHIFDKNINPLGVEKKALCEEFTSKPYILEYKYNFDALIQEIENGEKTEGHIQLVVAWTMGENWPKRYQVTPLLHFSNVHNRNFHGATHEIMDASTGQHVFYAIILSELIAYINDPDGVQEYQRTTYLEID